MTLVHLPGNFAMQSSAAAGRRSSAIEVADLVRHGGGLVALLEASRPPRAGTVRLHGLKAGRHYRVSGAARCFCRADADGVALIDVTLTRRALLVVEPVV